MIRGRPAWQWTGRLKAHGRPQAVDVFYTIPEGETPAVPMRLVIYTDESATDVFIIYEFFKFRLETPDDEVFQIPDLAVCQTSHEPKIPQITSDFHVKMEIKDRIYGPGGFESPVYDMNVHYEYRTKIASYTLETRGFKDLVNYFGDTEMA